jgi:hypothetical protein
MEFPERDESLADEISPQDALPEEAQGDPSDLGAPDDVEPVEEIDEGQDVS